MLNNIAILTSGNDCPGLNAAIRAVVRTTKSEGARIWAVRNGFRGLMRDQIEELTPRSVGDIIQRGGTVIGTARCPEFKEDEEKRRAGAENLTKRGIEGLIVIGGAGSLAGGRSLAQYGLNIVGIPGTIENDVWGTDYTIGSDTAANTVVDAINKLRDTACAHRRIIIIEVMGKTSGWLAMTTGIAGGAEYVLVPEAKYNLDTISTEIRQAYERGKRYSIIVIAEGAGSALELGKIVGEKTGIDTRVTVLGHIQRGGSPTVQDRINASLLGEKAAMGLISGKSDIMYGLDTGTVVEVPLADAITNTKTLEPEYIRLSKVLA